MSLDNPEDRKLAVLARATRARARAAEGAAIRDTDGRTYAAASVNLPSLKLTAVEAAIAMAVASGCQGLEAAVIHTNDTEPRDGDLDVLGEFARAEVPTYLVS
jgi:cytidine deaminase